MLPKEFGLKIMQIKITNGTLGSMLMAIVLGFALIPFGAMAQDSPIDKKLVQYVRDGKKSGQKQSEVQRNAMKKGWSASSVHDAVAYVYGSSDPVMVASANAEPSSNAGAQLQPGAPAGSGAGPEGTPQTGDNLAKDSSKSNSVKPALNATRGSTQNELKAGAGTSAAATVLHVPYEYRIGSGDVLHIAVWKEPEASANVVVRPDGMISTPLLKEIQVAGLTPAQAEKLITEKLVKVIQEPDVTVVVTGINSKKIYAVGAVKKEGPIPYTYSMTVMQAIAEAGGLTDYAKRKKIYVLRNEKWQGIQVYVRL